MRAGHNNDSGVLMRRSIRKCAATIMFVALVIIFLIGLVYVLQRLFWSPTPLTIMAPSPIEGPISVDGTKLVSENGQEVVLKGVAVVPPLFLREDNIDYEEYIGEVKSWGANVIRFPVYYCVYERENENVWSEIDNVIQIVKQNSLVMILDFHGIGYPPEETYHTGVTGEGMENIFYYKNEWLISFWNEASRRYRDENTVTVYELFNEVKRSQSDNREVSWLRWKAFVEENLLSTIRANDPDKLVLVSGLDYAKDLSWASEYPVQGTNIAYKRTSYFESSPVMEENIAVIFAETDEVPIRALEESGTSWVAHWFSPKWSPNLLASYYAPNMAGKDVLATLQGSPPAIPAFKFMWAVAIFSFVLMILVSRFCFSTKKQ